MAGAGDGVHIVECPHHPFGGKAVSQFRQREDSVDVVEVKNIPRIEFILNREAEPIPCKRNWRFELRLPDYRVINEGGNRVPRS